MDMDSSTPSSPTATGPSLRGKVLRAGDIGWGVVALKDERQPNHGNKPGMCQKEAELERERPHMKLPGVTRACFAQMPSLGLSERSLRPAPHGSVHSSRASAASNYRNDDAASVVSSSSSRAARSSKPR